MSILKGVHDCFAIEYLYTLDGTNTVGDETNEVYVMDGRSRVARVTVEAGQPDEIRYNIEDHLGNAGFTMSGDGSLIIREEYFPFGETSFGSYLIKRYRFCGKERDEESGLYYYGARYYAPWACRFTHICFFFKGVRECFAFVSIDPLAGKYPFYTPYQYAGNQPLNMIDLDGAEGIPGQAGGPAKGPVTGNSQPNFLQGSVWNEVSSENSNSVGAGVLLENKVSQAVVGARNNAFDDVEDRDSGNEKSGLGKSLALIDVAPDQSKVAPTYPLLKPPPTSLPPAQVDIPQEWGLKQTPGVEQGAGLGALLRTGGAFLFFFMKPTMTSSNDIVRPCTACPYMIKEQEKPREAYRKADEYERNPQKYGEEPTIVYRLLAKREATFPCRNCFDATTVKLIKSETAKIGITTLSSVEERYASPPKYLPELLNMVDIKIVGIFPTNVAKAIEKRLIVQYGWSKESIAV